MENLPENIWSDHPDLAQAQAERKHLQALRPNLECRAKALKATRAFFDAEGFLEVTTPTRIPTPALEDYIEAVPSGSSWLRTSPEFHMKRLIPAGYEAIYQIGPSFRREEFGNHHLTEFTMLEWYRKGASWLDVLADTQALFRKVVLETLGTTQCHFRNHLIDVALPWESFTVEEAFRRFANADVDDAIRQGCFEEVLCTQVEPHLGVNGVPTLLTEYPLACSGLSRAIPDKPNRVERWELYAAGLELGNACSELANPEEQLRRFQACALLRHREHRDIYRLDQPFMDMIRAGFPPTAGVAIGMDRLFMLLTDTDDITQTSPFIER